MTPLVDLSRRQVLAAAVAGVCATAAAVARAQAAWPDRGIRIVVGFPPGGGVDVMSRVISVPLGEALGQPIVVENKPGAVGNLAASDVIRAPADGYTLLVAATYTQTVNPSLIKETPSLARDMIPVAMIGRFKYHLVVRPSLNIKSVKELLDYARLNPGKLNYASGGQGSQPHLLGELLQKQAGIVMTHIPYRGSGPALQGVLAGDADLVFDPAGSYPHVQAGKLKMLATTSDKRPPLFPDVPTFNEVGVGGMEADAWIGMWVPAKTPAPIVDRMNRALATLLTNPAVRKRFEDMFAEAVPMDGARLNALLAEEEKTLSTLIRERNIRVD